jgi:chromosome segregation ATPase
MKTNLAIIILVILAVGLGVGLMKRHNKAVEQEQASHTTISEFSNTVVQVKTKLAEQENVNAMLETNLLFVTQESRTLSNNLARTSAELSRTSADLIRTTATLKKVEATAAETQAAVERAQAELAQRNARIAELESERDGLSGKIDTLALSIKALEKNIADTERKLAASEGDRDFLIRELKRLQADKSDMERQMNDLAFLREQVKQLKQELSVAKRLEWIRRGIYGAGEIKKPGQLMNEGFTRPAPTPSYSLDVEIKREGGVSVAPQANPTPEQ